MIAQGSKEVLLGDDCYRYDADHYLITAAALPTATRVTEVSEERPYLGVVLGLDPPSSARSWSRPATPRRGAMPP